MAAIYLDPLISLILMGVPFFIPGLAILFFEHLSDSSRLRYGCCALSFLYGCYYLQHPTPSPIINYMRGFMAVYHPVRTIELLLVCNPLSLRRLKKVGSIYTWGPFPPPYSFRRVLWIVDLMCNPRAIGWSHGPDRNLPPASQIYGKSGSHHMCKSASIPAPSRRSFFFIQVRRIVCAYLWFDFHINILDSEDDRVIEGIIDVITKSLFDSHLTLVTHRNIHNCLSLTARVISSQLFLDGMHALLSLIAVFLVPEALINTAAEPWNWPALFGSFKLSSPTVKGKNLVRTTGG